MNLRGRAPVIAGLYTERRLNVHEVKTLKPATPRVKVETVTADLSTQSGLSAMLDHIGDRPIEVLVNNARFGSYGPFGRH